MFPSSHLPMHSMPKQKKKKQQLPKKSNPPQNPFKGIHEAPQHALYKPQNPTKKQRRKKHPEKENIKQTQKPQVEPNWNITTASKVTRSPRSP